METVTLAAGCFWQIEIDFANVDGVTRTAVGYTGGTFAQPSYEDVCTGRTGHAEAVEIEFDPGVVSFDELLEKFWTVHDPTQMNRQGPDVGTQYRSAIFTHSPEQATAAEQSRARAQERFGKPIATEIAPATEFFRAEDYHQRYLEKRGMASCRVPASA